MTIQMYSDKFENIVSMKNKTADIDFSEQGFQKIFTMHYLKRDKYFQKPSVRYN